MGGKKAVRVEHRHVRRRLLRLGNFIVVSAVVVVVIGVAVFLFRSSSRTVNVHYGQRIGRSVRIENHSRAVAVLPQMEFQTVAIFSRVSAIGAAELIDVAVAFQVGIEHGFVDAGVGALVALERFRAEMVSQVVLQVVLVFGNERALGAGQYPVSLDMHFGMIPEFGLGDRGEFALLALERLDLALRVHFGSVETRLVVRPVFVVTQHIVVGPHMVLQRLSRIGGVFANRTLGLVPQQVLVKTRPEAKSKSD